MKLLPPTNLSLLFALGRPFAPLYGVAMKFREKLYQKGLKTTHKLPVPVISVGNLMLGGTGKTPLVQYLAKNLLAHGFRPAIISRGYGGSIVDEMALVSDGDTIYYHAHEAGDEPVHLARSLPGVFVLVGRKRIIPCRYAISELEADCIILDDGFQHLSVFRDLNLVLFDCQTLAGNSRVFPGGPLREPVSALGRSDCFLLTGKNRDNAARSEKFSALLQKRFKDKDVYFSSLSITAESFSDARIDLNRLATKAFAFCGIANPIRFKNSLSDGGILPLGFYPLPDHTPYSKELFAVIEQRAKEAGAEFLLTTEKDLVKLDLIRPSLPLVAAKPIYQVENNFFEMVLSRIKAAAGKREV